MKKLYVNLNRYIIRRNYGGRILNLLELTPYGVHTRIYRLNDAGMWVNVDNTAPLRYPGSITPSGLISFMKLLDLRMLADLDAIERNERVKLWCQSMRWLRSEMYELGSGMVNAGLIRTIYLCVKDCEVPCLCIDESFSMGRGMSSGRRLFSEIPEEMRADLTPDTLAEWIEDRKDDDCVDTAGLRRDSRVKYWCEMERYLFG